MILHSGEFKSYSQMTINHLSFMVITRRLPLAHLRLIVRKPVISGGSTSKSIINRVVFRVTMELESMIPRVDDY